jgi:hypothetical protein
LAKDKTYTPQPADVALTLLKGGSPTLGIS